ncbi:MAG: hypothetical protein PHO70_00355 [Candidatus Omnitrophica bacterium]|nr:hypothetical protein [Candidatus Omnitrophota bacterium]
MIKERRCLRRIIFTILILAVIDIYVLTFVKKIENRYETSGTMFRFENNDFFGIAPLVDYLKENKIGKKSRIVFFGNSVMFGYQLGANDTIAAKFENIAGSNYKCFNLGINGLGEENAYIILKNLIDSVDLVIVLHSPSGKVPIQGLYQHLDIDDEDAAFFKINNKESIINKRLSYYVGKIWKLSKYSHRIQNGLFQTSTKNYLYLHKADLFSFLSAKKSSGLLPFDSDSCEDLIVNRHIPELKDYKLTKADSGSINLNETEAALYKKFFKLASLKRKKIFFFGLDHYAPYNKKELSEYNRLFGPSLVFMNLESTESFTFDKTHLTTKGSCAVANMMYLAIKKNNDI